MTTSAVVWVPDGLSTEQQPAVRAKRGLREMPAGIYRVVKESGPTGVHARRKIPALHPTDGSMEKRGTFACTTWPKGQMLV